MVKTNQHTAYDKEYNASNAQAHIRNAPPLGIPLIARHIVIHKKKFDTKKATFNKDPIINKLLEKEEHSNAYIQHAQRIIDCFWSKKSGIDIYHQASSESHKLAKRDYLQKIEVFDQQFENHPYRSVLLVGLYNNVMVKVNIEVYSDYMTISIYFDLSKPDQSFRSGSKIGDFAELIVGHLDQIDSALKECENKGSVREDFIKKLSYIDARKNNEDPFLYKKDKIQKLQKSVEYIYDELISDFLKSVFQENSNSFEQCAEKIGRIACDFRSVVLFETHKSDIFSRFPSQDVKARGASCFDTEQAQRVLKYHWPMILATSKSAHNSEFVSSMFLDGRYIYVSSLGADSKLHLQGKLDTESNSGGFELEPLRFTLIGQRDFERWQLGRLVERVHRLGRLRLLALSELSEIYTASLTYNTISKQSDMLVNIAARKRSILSPKSLFSENYSSHLKSILSAISEIESTFDYGMMNRIERSHLFSSEFDSALSDLRSKRIEGWQPYEEFVKRKLYPIYDFMNRLGQKRQTVNANIDQAVNLFQSRQLKFLSIFVTILTGIAVIFTIIPVVSEYNIFGLRSTFCNFPIIDCSRK